MGPTGNLTICGRLKDIISRGGENISPGEIECVVIRHPDVADCAVIGVKHDLLGEVPLLAIVASKNVSTESLVEVISQYCRENLASYKQPEQIVAVDAIPRTGSGKAMRHRLREVVDSLPT